MAFNVLPGKPRLILHKMKYGDELTETDELKELIDKANKILKGFSFPAEQQPFTDEEKIIFTFAKAYKSASGIEWKSLNESVFLGLYAVRPKSRWDQNMKWFRSNSTTLRETFLEACKYDPRSVPFSKRWKQIIDYRPELTGNVAFRALCKKIYLSQRDFYNPQNPNKLLQKMYKSKNFGPIPAGVSDVVIQNEDFDYKEVDADLSDDEDLCNNYEDLCNINDDLPNNYDDLCNNYDDVCNRNDENITYDYDCNYDDISDGIYELEPVRNYDNRKITFYQSML